MISAIISRLLCPLKMVRVLQKKYRYTLTELFLAVYQGRDPEEQITGTDGEEHVDGSDADDDIDAGGGDDQIDAGGGADVIDAGEGNDAIYLEADAIWSSRYKAGRIEWLEDGTYEIAEKISLEEVRTAFWMLSMATVIMIRYI